eukprot:jgi/Mesen1/10192/ME000766S09561
MAAGHGGAGASSPTPRRRKAARDAKNMAWCFRNLHSRRSSPRATPSRSCARSLAAVAAAVRSTPSCRRAKPPTLAPLFLGISPREVPRRPQAGCNVLQFPAVVVVLVAVGGEQQQKLERAGHGGMHLQRVLADAAWLHADGGTGKTEEREREMAPQGATTACPAIASAPEAAVVHLGAPTSASVGVGLGGACGHLQLRAVPAPWGERSLPTMPPFDPPVRTDGEGLRHEWRQLLERSLAGPRGEAPEWSPGVQDMWHEDWLAGPALTPLLLQPSQASSLLEPVWNPPWERTSGPSGGAATRVPEFREVVIGEGGAGPVASVWPWDRKGGADEYVRGSASRAPYLPGGFEEEVSEGLQKAAPAGCQNGEWLAEILRGGPYLTTPPGFARGCSFPREQQAAQPMVASMARGAAGALSQEQLPSPPPAAAGTAPPAPAASVVLRFDDLFSASWASAHDDARAGSHDLGMQEAEARQSGGGQQQEQEVEEERVAHSVGSGEAAGEGRRPQEEEEEAAGEAKRQGDTRNELVAQLERLLAASSADSRLLQPGPRLQGGGEMRKLASSSDQDWAVMKPVPGLQQRFAELVPEPALSFPFELDTFQKEAVYHLERHESTFVAAHTSAGKTVVAEYAFALAVKHCTRAIYTSPIKTISNQKFRDFSARGFDVGLLTGDVSLRPEAPCLIMTTEILRSMLYRGADLLRDVEWVIFDEVHYVNDIERGVVWEEVIIMLPDHVAMVLLSATVPNTAEFANWIGRTKRKKIYVTGTTKRPVPLEHCLFYAGELYKVYERDTFLPEGIKAANAAHKAKTAPRGSGGGAAAGGGRGVQPGGRGGGPNAGRGAGGGRGGGRGGPPSNKHAPTYTPGGSGGGGGAGGWRSEGSQWNGLVQLLTKRQLLPVVVFAFSKNRCDQSADSLAGADLTSSSEKSEIIRFCDKSFARLKGSDRRLPQVLRIQELLRRGVGVHHAGLLPIVKEVVEMLFCRGVIKVLFSTETFAMGVNAPARAVAFHGLRKHDGQSFRQLLPGEYTQMAGRAGRRGLDSVGTVIICCWDEIVEEGDLKRLLTGKPTKLESQFRLTYRMILSLLRVEDLTVEDMLKRSFAEFHAQRVLPEKQKLLADAEGALRQLHATGPIECIFGDPQLIEDYYTLAQQAEEPARVVQSALTASKHFVSALVPGRAVLAHLAQEHHPSLGMILKGPYGSPNANVYIVLALCRGTPPVSQASPSGPGSGELQNMTVLGKGPKGLEVAKMRMPHHGAVGGQAYVVDKVQVSRMVSICAAKLACDPQALLQDVSVAAFASAVQSLQALEKQFEPHNPPTLHPLKDLKLAEKTVVDAFEKREHLLREMASSPCHRCARLEDHFALVEKQRALKEELSKHQYELSDAALQKMPDFNQRVEVLQHLGYLDAQRVVQMKGRVACEMNTADELIATEALFDDQLADLEASEAVALLSALVFQQKDASTPDLTPKLASARSRLYETALQVGEVQKSYGLSIDPEEYAALTLQFGLMEVVYEWAKGTPFSDICQLTNVPEGTIVRTIVRLDETCREFRNAARIIGDSGLYKKMEDASNAIKRDIVFAASLYVAGDVPS